MNQGKYKRQPPFCGMAIGLALAAGANPARAASLSAQQLLSDFNLITSGNVTTQQDIEGSAIVGGNLNGATFFNNSRDLPANPAVAVYGALTGQSQNLDNGGSIFYSGKIASGQVNFNGGGKQDKVLPNPLNYYTAPLNQLSASLSKLAPTAGASIKNGDFSANGAKGLVVFDLTGAQLASDLQNQQITFSGAGVTGFIINVTGNFSEPGGTNFNTAQQDVLFNFVNATAVNLGNWKASVVAPDASLAVLNGYIDGSVYAGSFTGGGELHNDNLYDGALPAVPEPASWTLMLIGFCAIGYATRSQLRRRTHGLLGAARLLV